MTMTYGEKLAGTNFNPSGDDHVAALKHDAANFIDLCHGAQSDATTSPEAVRLYRMAIDYAQIAQMLSVKAATWRE